MTSRHRRPGAIALAAVAALMIAMPAYAAEFTMKIGLATFKDVQHNWSM